MPHILRSTSVSLLVPTDWDDMQGKSQYSTKLIGSIEKVLATQGYSLKLVRLRDNETRSDFESFEAHLAEEEPAGFIVARVLQQEPVLDLLRRRAIPFVIFGHNSSSKRDAWVDIDNLAALWLTTRKCIDRGHRRIALLNGPAEYSYAVQRANGYRRALHTAGLSLDPDLILNGQPTFAMGSVMAGYLLQRDEPPTAMVCATDEMAMGALYACADLGLRPGRDISIVGYGASEAGAESQPQIASVAFDLQLAGRLLAEHLLLQLSPRGNGKRPVQQLLPITWVEGGSLSEPVQDEPLFSTSASSMTRGGLTYANAALHRAQQVVHTGSWRFQPLADRFDGSPEFCSVIGVPRDTSLSMQELLGQLVAADVEVFEGAWERAQQGRPFDIEVRLQSDGLERVLQWRGEFVINCGELAYAEGAVQDVSEAAAIRQELVHARNEALEASRAKDLFLANMSHEIRTPIHAILGLTDLLKRQKTTPETANTIDKIGRSGKNLLNIINDILLISKVESNALEIEEYNFDLQTIVDDLGATVEGLLSRKRSVNLILPMIDSQWRYLRGDPTRLSQVLLNLLANAVKFTNSGEIELAIELLPAQRIADEVRLAFRVRDTGIGIATDRLSDLFNPFTQADNSISRTYGGTGLGLAIVESLLKLMGGEIQVESKLGLGSTFSFELTLGISQIQEPHHREQDRLRVMIVDYSATSRMHAAQVVLELGWSATAIESGVEALTELELSPEAYDLLLLDYAMPGMNGLEVARQVRSSPEYKDIRILIVSTEPQERLDPSLSHYVDGYIHKPLEAAVLLEAIADDEVIGLVQPEILDVAEQQLAGTSIYCVDDSDINLELLVDMLQNQGAKVATALSGAQALDDLDGTQSFDLLLCDIQMPDMDGFELTRQIHQIPAYAKLPVIGVSAGVAATRMPEALAAGMVGYLEKPFNLVQLIAAIMPVLRGETKEPIQELTPRSNTLVFNPEQALRNWSRLDSFVKQLQLFTRRYADENLMTNLVDGLRFEEALQQSHKLKGVAGVLGLEQLTDVAKRLELLLRTRGQAGDMSGLRRLVAQFTLAQVRALDAVKQWLETQQIASTDPSVLKRRVSAKTLLGALQTHDPVATDRCLESEIEGVPADVMEQVRNAVSGFDFPRAALLLRETLASSANGGQDS